MRPEATRAMLRMQQLMQGLAPEDQAAIAYEFYRTYGGNHVSPVPKTRGDTRKNTRGNTPENTVSQAELLDVSSPTPPDARIGESLSEKQEKKRQLQANAAEVLEFLNEKTGRSYRPVEENLRFIRARLATCSVEDMKGVVARKTRAWLGTPQAVYLRPKTLFSPTNFEQYIGEQPKHA